MSSNSSIEWTETTWNPVTGCTEASTGCANCYARGMSKRLAAMARADEAKGRNPGKKAAYKLSVLDDGRWSGVVTPVPEVLSEPLRWKKPRRVFVNSMSDLFWGTDADLQVARQRGAKYPRPVPFEFIDQVFAVMALCPQHTFQVLTKRPERMAEYLAGDGYAPGPGGPLIDRLDIQCFNIARAAGISRLDIPGWAPTYCRFPLPNVWLGTSVENQATADERIPHLLRCPASVRWLSMEPLLGSVDYIHVRPVRGCKHADSVDGCCGHPSAMTPECHPWADCPVSSAPGIDWVVVGGESGHNARPMHPDWARSIRDQCQQTGVPFFFKQWGAWGPVEYDNWWGPHGVWGTRPEKFHHDFCREGLEHMERVGKKASGRELDGRTWDEYPAVKGVAHA